jgi:hypothetical protein
MRGGHTDQAARFAQLPVAGDAAIVCCSAAAVGRSDQPMQRLEENWFAPLQQALISGELRELKLWIGSRGWRITRSWLPRWRWRRPAPWWQRVAPPEG